MSVLVEGVWGCSRCALAGGRLLLLRGQHAPCRAACPAARLPGERARWLLCPAPRRRRHQSHVSASRTAAAANARQARLILSPVAPPAPRPPPPHTPAVLLAGRYRKPCVWLGHK
jgi:hypothetical protein